MNTSRNIKFISWNVRGLNDKDKRAKIKHVVMAEAPHLICLQETKIQSMDPMLVKQTVGAKATHYRAIPACNTAGGLLVAWDGNFLTEIEHTIGNYCLSIDFSVNIDTSVLRFTGVYGPSNQVDKGAFFCELGNAKQIGRAHV